MSSTDQPTREQLTEAIETIRRQLELLRSGPTIGGLSDDRGVTAELEAEPEALRQVQNVSLNVRFRCPKHYPSGSLC